MRRAFDLPRGEIFAFDEIDVRLDPAPHPYEIAHRETIAAHWLTEYAANPALFDGPVAFFSSLRLEGQKLAGRCHIVGFSTFLQWRASALDGGGEHCFAHAMPVSADGALLAVRMARHTANAGRVYFAAGSFDPDDFVADRLDARGNMRREVLEETGLDLDAAAAEPGWHGWSHNGRTIVFRRFRFGADADALAARIRAHIETEKEPEIEAPVILRSGNDLPGDALPHMAPLVEWHFGRETRGGRAERNFA